MYFHILTLFPEMIEAGLNTSITGRAAKNGLIFIDAVNIRDYTNEPHGKVDDYPYGGGAGMIMQAQPIYDCFKAVEEKIGEGRKTRVLYTSPAGRVFDQEMARELAKEDDLIILCGHYEGVDERALKLIGAQEVSIGDYVLTGGELAAMVITDAVSRMVPGVLSNEESKEDESFSKTQIIRTEIDRSGKWPKKRKVTKEYTLLEYPQYTRPAEFMGLKVPDILLSGDHEKIDSWRKERSLERTKQRRPDMLKASGEEGTEAK